MISIKLHKKKKKRKKKRKLKYNFSLKTYPLLNYKKEQNLKFGATEGTSTTYEGHR